MGDLEGAGGRREQIVEAALDLLAEMPLEQLTTQRIAERLGLSQAAVFRHFGPREAILRGVAARARATLAAVGETVLAQNDDPVEQLRELARRIVLEVERTPGLARVLFLAPEPGEASDALRALVAMLAALVAERVREGQRRGSLAAAIAPDDAATMFIGLVQGLALRARPDHRARDFEDDAGRLVALWLASMGPSPESRPVAPSLAADDAGGAETAAPEDGIRILDVRPILARGDDPLGEVLRALAPLRPGSVLVITAPFRPGPLVALLASRGHSVVARQVVPGTWSVEVVVGGAPAIVDLTDLEPPEPLERTLLAAERLPPGGVYLARLPRYPQLLVAELRQRQVRFAVECEVDGTALVWLGSGR